MSREAHAVRMDMHTLSRREFKVEKSKIWKGSEWTASCLPRSSFAPETWNHDKDPDILCRSCLIHVKVTMMQTYLQSIKKETYL